MNRPPRPPLATLRRLARPLARLEPLLVLALAPLFIFPQPGWVPWLLLAVLLLWASRWLARGRLTRRTPLDGPLLGLVAMALVSAWATYDLAVSFSKLCGVALGIVLFYALVNSIRSARALWLATGLLLAGGVAVAGLYLVGGRWKVSKVPLLTPVATPISEGLPHLIQDVPRAEQGFNPNQVGGTLALFVPLAASLLVYRLRRAAGGRSRGGWIWTAGLAAGLGLILFVLLLTQSRMAYVATAVTLALVGGWQGRRLGVATALLLALGLGLLAYYGVDQVGQAIFGIPNLEVLSQETSWAGRVEIWKRALRVIQDHPLTGIGFDTLPPVVHARYPTFLIQTGNDFTHAHNIFVQIGLNLGLPGLVAFVWLLVAMGRMLWQVWRGADSAAQRVLAAGLFLGLLANFVFGLGDAVDLGAKPGVFMWACFGLGAALWTQNQTKRTVPGTQSQTPEKKEPAKRRPSLARLLAASALLLTVVWGYSQFTRLRTWRSLIEADLKAVESLAQEGAQGIAPQTPGELLHTTRADLQGAQAELALPLALAPHLCWLPGYGPDLQALPVLLDIGLDLTATGEEMLAALSPWLDGTAGEEGRGLANAMAGLQEARPQLNAALATLEETRQARQKICTARLSPQVRGWVARLDETLPLLQSGARGALALPELLGATRRRTFLVLIQNSDELRPTGGFISGVARLTVEGGQVVELTFQDSYAVDDLSQPYPAPPAPLREIMGSQMWLVRDSNWHPDFVTSAQVARELYQRYDPTPLDGILALDQQALQSLVAALGPLQVVEHPEPITAENIVQALRASWAPGEQGFTEAWRQHRKDFIGRLLTAAVHRLQNEPGQVDMLALGLALVNSLEQRHLAIYVPGDEPVAQVLHQTGWDGAILNPPGDYLMIVDANLGFNKVNPHVTQSLSYTVDLRDPTRPRAELLIRHQHQGPDSGRLCRHESRFDLTYEQMMARCYWDYVRVYVPQGSQPLAATPHPVPGNMLLGGEGRAGLAERLPDQANKSVFATFFVLAPGQASETRFVYDLPNIVTPQAGYLHYRLLVQKQMGTEANPIHITLILPDGIEVIDAFPTVGHRDGNRYRHALFLDTDVEIQYLLKEE